MKTGSINWRKFLVGAAKQISRQTKTKVEPDRCRNGRTYRGARRNAGRSDNWSRCKEERFLMEETRSEFDRRRRLAGDLRKQAEAMAARETIVKTGKTEAA